MYGGRQRCVQGFGTRPEGKRPLGRPRRRWEDNIKMDLQKVVQPSTEVIDLAQNRDRWWEFVHGVMKLLGPLNAGNFWTG